jgi:hypothetical protein
VDVIHTNTSVLCHHYEYTGYCDPWVTANVEFTFIRWRYSIVLQCIVYFSHDIEISVYLCICSLRAKPLQLATQQRGSIKQDSLRKINYSSCGLEGSVQQGDECCRGSDQCPYIC